VWKSAVWGNSSYLGGPRNINKNGLKRELSFKTSRVAKISNNDLETIFNYRFNSTSPFFPAPSSIFFQAEDGIRDSSVTRVQTCALPILHHRRRAAQRGFSGWHAHRRRREPGNPRSEERRVEKECRSRWSPYH